MVCWKWVQRRENTFLLSSYCTSNKVGTLAWQAVIWSAYLIWTRSCVKCWQWCWKPAECNWEIWGLNMCRPSSVQSLVNARVHLYTYQLCDSVDVDLSFLQACAEEHRCWHQKVISYAVSVDIHRCNLTAIIGANLKETLVCAVWRSVWFISLKAFNQMMTLPAFSLLIKSNHKRHTIQNKTLKFPLVVFAPHDVWVWRVAHELEWLLNFNIVSKWQLASGQKPWHFCRSSDCGSFPEGA